ncbi:MAG: proline--tRNA ligase [Puniceicoccaceae bacterium]
MSKNSAPAISPTREEDYPEWYQQVIRAAELAETSAVRGCMVIKPWGFAVWEHMRDALDRMFKETGHRNAYFPLLIPLSFLQKEADHVEGFAKECAVVTHSRLELDESGKLVPAGKLEEPMIIRPTSETIIGDVYSQWVQSYRDLPILINQWANVVRWEMRTRLFLRTAEFLWQEGHTVHETESEAEEETQKMLGIYATFAEEYMAMPVLTGRKSEGERFPGAVDTLCIEAMMQDGKALQAGTSHFLGQNFSRASEIKFLGREGKQEYAWTTSWGVSTRLIGALVMTHSDDDGLVLPPRLAPLHVVIIPVIPKDTDREAVMNFCHQLAREVVEKDFAGAPVRVEVDDRDMRGGEKVWGWVKKGVPIRIEVGPRDLANDSVFLSRRDEGPKEKKAWHREGFIAGISDLLEEIQANLLARAKAFREEHSQHFSDYQAFARFFSEESGEAVAGFAYATWCGDPEVEERLQRELKVTIRCLPFDQPEELGPCLFTGKPGKYLAVFAKGY